MPLLYLLRPDAGVLAADCGPPVNDDYASRVLLRSSAVQGGVSPHLAPSTSPAEWLHTDRIRSICCVSRRSTSKRRHAECNLAAQGGVPSPGAIYLASRRARQRSRQSWKRLDGQSPTGASPPQLGRSKPVNRSVDRPRRNVRRARARGILGVAAGHQRRYIASMQAPR